MTLPPPPVWTQCLRPGMRIHLASGAGCPVALLQSLVHDAPDIGDLELIQGPTLDEPFWATAKLQPHLKVNAVYLDTTLAKRVAEGIVEYSPLHYSDLPVLFRDRTIRIDAALIMVSPPDAYGYCSLGPAVEWTPSAIDAAEVVIAQINPHVPRTTGLSHIHISKINFAIEEEAPLVQLPPAPVAEDYAQIGHYIAQLIANGDTLQFGVGPVGNALVEALGDHRNLGIHSEVVGDGVMRLFRAGVIDNSAKNLLPGKAVSCKALGTRELYDFLDTNPHFDFRPTDFTNNPLSIARNKNMVAVNGALMADLSGQIAADSVEGHFRSGVGSMVDFVRGAAMSEGGRPIIALPSTGTDEDGQRFSRIVAELSSGAGVGCHRSDVHYMITEFGIATLRGRTIQERVQEVIQIAHPDFREDLLRQAREHHLLPDYFQLPPPYTDAGHGIAVRRMALVDGRDYILRPLNPSDDRRLQDFFYSHTEETIVRRYGFTITRMSRERAFELVGINQNRDLALGIFELQGPRQVIHAVGRYYLDSDGKAAEMAFVVGERKRRIGMARTLLERMLEVARDRKLSALWAQVDRDNTAMLALFRKLGGTESEGDDLHTIRVDIPIKQAAKPEKKAFLHFPSKRSDPKP